LYKAFNTQRSASDKPSLSIQIVVHTGNLEELSKLTEEAAELSRRERQDHMVISRHVAYHPELQQRVLQADNCTPLASGAVCLARLSSEYQDLLDLQIRHFSPTL
jgi:DNA-binding IclR family transcriptional regulator